MRKVIVQQLPNSQLVVTIPKAIAELKGFRKSTKAYWVDNKEGLILTKNEER